jgi:putative phage-type endonuclease
VTVTPIRPPVTVGGSDAAAAAGVDPYRSRVMLWLELTGRVQRPESEAMRWGTLLQPIIAAELSERGVETMPGPAEYRDETRPWLVGHPDGFVVVDGERGVLEIKTAGTWSHNADGPPLHYVAQVQHYLHLTDLDVGLIAVLVGGQRLDTYTIERDQRAIDLLLAAESDFVRYVERDTPPPVDGSDSARAALGLLYPEARAGKTVRLLGEDWADLRELRRRREARDVLERQITALENRLKAVMGDAEQALSPYDTPALSWKTVTTTRLDITRLRAEQPEIAAQYSTTTTTRRFALA